MSDAVAPSRPSRSAGPSRDLVEGGFAYEIATSAMLHAGLNLADMAHLLDLATRGIMPPAEAAALARVLLDADAIPAAEFGYDAAHGEPYNSRERVFAARLGAGAGWLHAGRPRREATRVAFRLHLRREVCRLVAESVRLARALASRAEEHRATVFADHTYLQQAQPSTVGHYLTSFAYPVLRDAERLLDVVGWVNASPGGAGGVNGSRLVHDRAPFAGSLGFGHVIVNTRDAMWQVDGLVALAATASSLASTETSLAEDLEIWASAEFDYVDLAEGYTRSSVLMPQKRNPYALSMIRGTAGLMIGHLTTLLAVQKSPSARSDSLIFAYGEVPIMVERAVRMTGLAAGVVETLTINDARLAEALDAGFSQATDLAEEVMTRCGLDYRRAYEVVGRTVRTLAAEGRAAKDLTTDDLDRAAEAILGAPLGLDAASLADVLDPVAIVASRTATGGAAPAAVDAMVAEIRSAATAVEADASARLARFDAAEADVRARTAALCTPDHRRTSST